MSENQSFRGRKRQGEKIRPKSIAARLENHFKLFLILKKSNGEKSESEKKPLEIEKTAAPNSNEEKRPERKPDGLKATEKYFLSRSESIDFIV